MLWTIPKAQQAMNARATMERSTVPRLALAEEPANDITSKRSAAAKERNA
jgi:hypothetical protein